MEALTTIRKKNTYNGCFSAQKLGKKEPADKLQSCFGSVAVETGAWV